MSDKPRLRVVLCWHMHQPEYRDSTRGTPFLPWVYLHAIKDYVDMAAHLEAVPEARAVVNFAPVLLEQLADCAVQAKEALDRGRKPREPLLNALAFGPPEPLSQRVDLIRTCLRANEQRMIRRFPRYQQLVEMGRWMLDRPDALAYLDTAYYQDLVVWYHLAWLGESVRSRPDVQALTEKGRDYNREDRHILLSLVSELLSGITGRYRRLTERGQVELSVTPYEHPMLPLLLDFNSTREAMPDALLPASAAYPGGKERARWHIDRALELFEDQFGHRPIGCWPAEGGVSEASLRLLAEAGFRWAASGEQVLRHSITAGGRAPPDDWVRCLHRPYRVADVPDLTCFFRDDGLSDLIGFTYSGWNADHAVANLVHHLENIAQACRNRRDAVVPIILDGENAWEFYPENGSAFLNTLYQRLSTHPGIELTTFSRVLADQRQVMALGTLVAGSWVQGTFSTWIGTPAKNRAWDMLCEAKRQYDRALSEKDIHGERLKEAERQLAVCEGSDWFWWPGDNNPAESVRDFDRLYRRHLERLYELIESPAPGGLVEALSEGGGQPAAGGVMRPGQVST